MALIHCPECNKEVSDSAVACPFCGYGVAAYIRKENLKNKTASFRAGVRCAKPVIKKLCLCLSVIAVIVCVIASVSAYNHYDAEQAKAQRIYDNINRAILSDSPTVTIESFRELSRQSEYIKEMEQKKNQTVPVAIGVLAAVEVLIFVVLILVSSAPTKELENAEISCEIDAGFAPWLAWEELTARQNPTVGRCESCGQKHQQLVFYKFEDQFGQGQGNLCYDCFYKKYK